jgi:hypothetical protein
MPHKKVKKYPATQICCIFNFHQSFFIMRSFKVCCLLAISLVSLQAVQAQKKTVKNTVTPVKKFKPPKLHTWLESFTDSVSVSVEQAQKAIAAPLVITDDKKNEYTLTYYNVLYKRRVVTEDEQTGKTSPATSVVSDHFKTTPLPELWVNTLREQLQPGEELLFFDIIVKDQQGRVMYASNLKLMVR